MTEEKKNITSLLRDNKTVFIIIAVVLFLIELEIFAVAAMKSGRNAWLQILDDNGNVIHETDGKNLSDFNKYYFEKTFGRPVEEFQKRLEIKEIPFPFRAWFTAAVGIPIGIILLFAFVVRAYVTIFYGDELKPPPGTKDKMAKYETELERIIMTVSSFNIFTIGFLILLGVFMYWVLPNMITYVSRVSIETLVRFKWAVAAMAAAAVGLFIWIIYLRYLLARRGIDNQAEIDKLRLQLEYFQGKEIPAHLAYHGDSNPPRLVTMNEAKAVDKTANGEADGAVRTVSQVPDEADVVTLSPQINPAKTDGDHETRAPQPETIQPNGASEEEKHAAHYHP
jgi:hypothetical protein